MAPRILWALALAALLASCGLVETAPQEAPSSAPVRDVLLVSEQSAGTRVRLVETVTQRLYEVDGATEFEVRASLNARGPGAGGAGAGARRGGFDGLTDWSLRWSFRYDRGPGYCALANSTLELAIDVLLPELAAPDAISPELLARWQSYVSALENHEMGHVDRQRALAQELAAAFEAAPPAANCSDLGRQLNALGEDYLQRIRLADATYDLETNHGMTQGAIFP